jgi:hypothetical protein
MRSYLRLSGLLFALMAVVQITRLVWQWPIRVATFEVPLWISVIALLITGSLAIWALRLRGRATDIDSPEF